MTIEWCIAKLQECWIWNTRIYISIYYFGQDRCRIRNWNFGFVCDKILVIDLSRPLFWIKQFNLWIIWLSSKDWWSESFWRSSSHDQLPIRWTRIHIKRQKSRYSYHDTKKWIKKQLAYENKNKLIHKNHLVFINPESIGNAIDKIQDSPS